MSFRTKTGGSVFGSKGFRPSNVLQFLRLLIIVVLFIQSCQAKSITLHLPPEVMNIVDTPLHLEYSPAQGTPPSNLTFNSSEVKGGVVINNVLTGTEYTFHLYYTNASSYRVWTANIPTEPDPPINLLAEIKDGKVAELSWEPPNKGNHTGFRLKAIPLSDDDDLSIQDFIVKNSSFELRDLTPGASYEIRLYTMLRDKESQVFASTNFTTKPSPPGRFIVWFRNDTTLLVLWQPPYPSGVFDRYRVTIIPPDAVQSVLYVEKEGKPPVPAQAAFYGLVPGHAYNISVHTVSGRMISDPTEAQYRTIPLPPTNVTVNLESITSYSFVVQWSPPKSFSEFNRYQVSLGFRTPFRQMFDRNEERIAVFDKDLKPGQTYEVVVKTLSGNVASWEITKNITTRPLPVMSVNSSASDLGVEVKWFGHNDSIQDSYVVKYSELDAFNSDNNIKIVEDENINLVDLLPGRNYSIHIVAASNGISSDPVVIYHATKPTPPVIESSEAMKQSLNISWKADVTSHQEWYSVIFVRNDTKEKQERITTQTWLVVDDLYPGAIYEFNVYAVSNGLWSDPVTYLQSVPPKPPEHVKISFNNSSMIVSWHPPQDSLVSHFLVKYRALDSDTWKNIGQIINRSYEIKDLLAGEKYNVEVISMNNHIESIPVEIQETIYPNSIEEVQVTADAYNVSFTWAVPKGRIDYFLILYFSADTPPKEWSQQILANESKAGEMTSTTIYDLIPGQIYFFHFYTVSYNMRSKEYRQSVQTLPVIDSVINIVTDEHATKTLLIRYTPTPARNVIFDRYRIQLSDPSVPAQEKSLKDDRLVIFDNLVPGRLYNISIWTVSGKVRSNPIQRQARLYPEPVDDVFATSIRDDEITLAWNAPLGDKDKYEVEYQDHQGHLVRNVTSQEEIAYIGMKPHHNYTFLVTVLSGYDTATVRRSRPVSQTFQTRESVPGKIHRFGTAGIRPNEVTLKWTLPATEQNGVLTGFNISYYVKGSPFLRYALFEPMDDSGVIHNLIPGRTYVFEIQAHTKVGPGAKSQLEFATPIWAPPPPGDHVYPTEVSHTSSTIRIRFRKNFFSEIFGPIKAYSIIAAEDETRDSNTLEVASWSDVQGESIWPPYQVAKPYNPFNDIAVEDFTIGTENCKGVIGYCNGALKASTKYRVKVRAFTAHANFSDTGYSHPIQTDADNKVLIIIILVTLSLLLLVVIILVILKRRRAGVFAKRRREPHGKEDGLSITETEIVTSRPIKLKDFADHYHIMSADSDFRFSEEFELLKHVGRDKPCAAADLPVNRPKNRFTNILPYDHSRIKLMPTDDEEGSDYINANYIPGFNSPREFIVTQGPLHSTHDDFWRMVWEQNSRAIVMLTRCIEKGREKCDHYWPYDMQPVYYGDIQVTILNESQYPHWTISEFKVSRGEQSRIVRHFHFTTWPDFGVPDPPQVLVKFVRAFRERVIPDSKPVVVHCSAGVGRSGTLIALDHLLQHINKYDFVDIFGIVYEMRKERVWMVQNEQQYICIHQCLLCVLEGKEDVLDSLRPEVHDNQGFEDDEGIAESGI